MQEKTKRILLGHLASFGDCLYATAVARQIKTDYPNCHLTWAIGSNYNSVIDNNPYVDDKWIVPFQDIKNIAILWEKFEKEAWKRKEQGDFDEVFLTQFCPSYEYKYDGYIRSTTFRGYPKPITVPVTPVIRLSDQEIDNVRSFAQLHKLHEKEQVILFECFPKSLQSFVNTEFSITVAKKIIEKFPKACLILSSNASLTLKDANIIDGSILSFRENAELTKYCSLLIGCSSGITWLSTSDWAKKIPMIQLINSNSLWFASVVRDHKLWQLSTEHIIEMAECDCDQVLECVSLVFLEGVEQAKIKFHQDIPPSFNAYDALLRRYLQQGEFSKLRILINNHLQRNGLYLILKWNIQKLPIKIFRKLKKALTTRK